VKIAKEQAGIISNIESLRNLKEAEKLVGEEKEDEARKRCDKMAYWIKFKMDAGGD